MRETFFGLDEFRASESKALRLVEGFFDKERTGPTALAAFRSQISRRQRSVLIGLKIKQVSLIFDAERSALSRAWSIAEDLSAIIPVVKIVRLPDGFDPDTMDQEDIFEIEAATPPLIL